MSLKATERLCVQQAVNVGDSGLTVVRKGVDGKLAIAFKTNPQMHFFNCPFQLGGSSPGIVVYKY